MSNHVCVSRIVRCTALAAVVGVFLLATAAQAASIGFNFSGGWQSGPFNLAAGDTAGVVPQQNWNNWMGAGGQTAWNYTNIALMDNTGAASAAKAQIGPYFGQNDGPGPGNNTGGIQTLYGGKTREGNGNNWTAGFSAIPYLKYDVYAYTTQNETIAISGAATGNGSQTLTYGGSIATYVQGSNYLKWSNVSGSSFTIASTSNGMANVNAFQIVQASKPIVSIADADWATATTWDLAVSPNTASDYDVTVRHSVSFNEAAQVVSSLTLDNLNSNMTIPVGAGLTGATDVQLGTLTVNGGLIATTLKVSGGSATMASGSAGTIGTVTAAGGSTTLNGGTIGTVNASAGTTLVGGGAVTTLNTSAAGTAVSGGAVTTVNVTGGSANLSGGSIGTVTASGGSTTLATQVGALNANSGSTILGGAGGGAVTANLKTGSTVDTQGNYVAISSKVTLNNGLQISVSDAPVSVDLQGTAGDNIGDASKVARLRLNGGKVTVFKPGAGPETLLMSEGFETNGQGTRYNSNTNLADPAVPANTAAANSWGRVTSVPTHTFYGNGSNPTEGSVMWLGEETQPLAGNRSGDTLERTASWLDFNAMSVAGKTGLRLTVDLMADGLANGSRGPETNDEFKIRVKNVDTGVSSDVEYLEGQANNPYKSKMPGSTTQLNTPGAAVSVSYDLGALSLTNTMQLTFAHSQNGGSGVEYLAFDNIKVYGKSIVADAIDMSLTSLELTADTTLDIGAASVASFFDVFVEVGLPSKTLRITGSNWSAVSGLASFFDVTAPNNLLVSLGGTDGSTYQDVVVIPEPATMSLLVLGGLALLRRRTK